MKQQELGASYDVCIVGGGPAGLFAAQELLNTTAGLSVVLFEMGPEPSVRHCPADHNGCKNCTTCTVLSGLGGAGLHSDGKLVLDLSAGGYAHEFVDLDGDRSRKLVSTIESTLRKHDGMSEEGPDWTLHQAELGRQFAQAGLDIKVYPVLHLGTHNLTKIMTGFVDSLRNSTGPNGTRLTIIGRSEVVGISRAGDGFSVETTRGRTRATRVVLAVGKSGAPKMRELLAEMGATDIPRPVWIGVRVDAPYESGRDLLAISFDPKISMRDRMGRVKTHCFCRHGSLLIMKHRGACLVGGHSPVTAKNVRVVPKLNEADRLSFNVLASRNFDASRVQEVFDVFARVGRDSVVVQDLGSFLRADAALADRYAHLEARVPARTADVRSLLDSFMGLGSSIADLLARLGTIYPGVIAPNNLVFAPAIEWDYGSVKVDAEMQTTIPGLYAVGDGAGISQGIVHAGATGLICAEAIARATHRPH